VLFRETFTYAERNAIDNFAPGESFNKQIITVNRIAVFLICIMMTATVSAQTDADKVYVFSYFKNNGKDGLHLAYSKDGYRFTALNKDSSFLTPVLSKDSLMRDPCIIRGADNKFHMVWTVSWSDKGIGYASSPDLVNWSEQQYIPVMAKENLARNCWAPEITYDAKRKEYMIYWATTIVPDSNRFIMFLKDETRYPPQKNIRVATSDKLTEGYSFPSFPITGNYWAEGPTIARIKDQWVVYFDKYRDHKYGAVASKDLKTWEDVSDKLRMPTGIRHGTIFTITTTELANLLK
jgi:hypothetical protein